MPTPLIPSEKQAFISLVLVAPYPGGVTEAMRLSSTDFFNNYEDIPVAIQRQQLLFSGSPSYLYTCMSVFSDNHLTSAGIYYNKTTDGVTNPSLIIKSAMTSVNITTNTNTLQIFGSNISYINMTSSVSMGQLYLANSTVNLVNCNFLNAYIGIINVKNVNNLPSVLKGVVMGSLMGGLIAQVVPDAGATYGGILPYDPNNLCSNTVTNLNAGDITDDSVVLMWNLPPNPSWSYNSYLFLNIYYRLSNASGWTTVDNSAGDFIQSVGFVFRYLQSDTYYDFMVSVQCTNGGISSQTVTAQTICCGDKTVQTQKECWFTVAILTSPGVSPYTTPEGAVIPVTITLCNGMQIPGQYATGTTLTIPQLANQNIDPTIILNNQYQQGIPFSQILAQWNLAGTPLIDFQNGDIVSIKATLPA